MNRLFRRAASAVAAPKSSPARAARRPRPLSLQVENVERRELMAANFLQGVAFIDNNSNSVFDQGDAPKPSTTIQLFSSTNPTTPLASTVTNADGYYRFDNLSAGKYKLVEVASNGYVATNAQVNAVFNAGAWNGQSIDVTVADATTAAPVMVARTPGIAGGLAGVNTAYVLTSGSPASNQFTPNPDVTNAHQFQAQLVAANGITPVSSSFYTYCMDLYHIAPGYYGAFTVTPETVPQNLPPAVTTNLGQIGWLYNHYGKNLASSGADGAGLQLALYELVYDSTPNLTSGGFVVDQSKTDPVAFAAAQNYLALAAGRDERAIFLNTIDPVDTTDPATWGTQGFITTESFNFANTASASIGDTVFLDKNANGIQDSGDTGIANVTVNLLDGNNNVVGTQKTDGNGKYLFSNLIPGTYSVQFVKPGGYNFTAKDQGSNDAVDSDADTATGKTAQYTLTSGQSNLTVDAGVTIITGSISGTKYRDLTGNGLTSDDTPLAGVKVYLDGNKNGQLDPGEVSTVTKADGTYSFTGVAPGTYVVREVVASGWVRTGPTLSDNYCVTVSAGKDSGGNDFANAEAGCDCQIYCVTYIINGCRQVSDLRGNVSPGDSVVARFSVRNASASNPAVFSLVSYVAPNSYFSAGNASQQYVYDMATGTYTANGTYCLQIDVPDSYFQVDFVCGQVINKFGPAGSNIFYSAQDRLISADNDGCKTYDNLLDKKDTGTADFWAGSYGQNLIKSLNSGSTSKTLGNWLASNFPNLYGSLAGKTNADIACIMQSINDSCYQVEADVLATALSIYVTDADLAGMKAVGYGFHVSFLGSGAKKVNVGSTGVFLGLNSNSFYSLYDLIDAADGKASKGIILGSSSYGRSKVGGLFSALNCAGSIC